MLSKSDRVLLFAFVCLNAILIAGSLSAVEKKKVLSPKELYPVEVRLGHYLACSEETQQPEYCGCFVEKMLISLQAINVSIFDFHKVDEKLRMEILEHKVVKPCLKHVVHPNAPKT